jgi:hypothetical protein
MTTLLILPGAAYLYFLKYRFSKKSFKSILPMLGIFFSVLFLLYLYLPIRATQSPVINWGNPVDLERFMRHITGNNTGLVIFAQPRKTLGYFLLHFEFNVSLFISLLGCCRLFEYRRIFIFSDCFLYSSVFDKYDINDIDSYFLLAYISISFSR